MQILCGPQHKVNVMGAAAATARRLGAAPRPSGSRLLRRPQHEDHHLAAAQHRAATALPALAGRARSRHPAGQPALPLSCGEYLDWFYSSSGWKYVTYFCRTCPTGRLTHHLLLRRRGLLQRQLRRAPVSAPRRRPGLTTKSPVWDLCRLAGRNGCSLTAGFTLSIIRIAPLSGRTHGRKGEN